MSGQCPLEIYLLLNHNGQTEAESQKFYSLIHNKRITVQVMIQHR